MRRKRRPIHWWLYGLGACVALMTAALVLCAIERRGLVHETGMLREQINAMQEPTGIGGAEAPTVEQAWSPDWRFPLQDGDFKMYTSPFGYRISPFLNIEMAHQGVDIAGVWRSRIVAVADGVVTMHWPVPDSYWKGHPIFGGYIEITHANGLVTGYAHLSDTRVHTGDRVRAGQVIGRMGDSGKAVGAHLHISVRSSDGEYLNPLHWIQEP